MNTELLIWIILAMFGVFKTQYSKITCYNDKCFFTLFAIILAPLYVGLQLIYQFIIKEWDE